jgi:hypothetical protein
MTNLFKQNSRFSSLVNDDDKDGWIKAKNKKSKNSNNDIVVVEKEVKINSFKTSPSEYSGFNSFNNRDNRDNQYNGYNTRYKPREKKDIEAEENEKKKKLKLEQERINAESLKEENFPSISNIVKVIEDNSIQLSYKEKIQKTKTKKIETIDTDLVNLKSGWVVLTRDNKKGKTIIKTLPGEENLLKNTLEPEVSEKQIGRDILKALVYLHEKRTREYITTYGEYTWEKMFKTPNWIEEELENLSDSDDDWENDDEYNPDDDYNEY